MSDNWGSPAEGPGPRGPGGRRTDPRTFLWVLVVIGIVAFFVGSHRLHSYELIYYCVLIPSVILHEVSHGAVANFFGDPTAKRAGRLTLNPIPHIDVFGSIILPGILVLSSNGAVAFGYAKPVPVTVSRLRHPRNDSVWVSLAGPATNAVLFVVLGLVFRYWFAHKVFLAPGQGNWPLPYQFLIEGALANLTVCFFNLLPIPPLDGSVVIERLLPRRALEQYFRLRPYGMLIVFLIAIFALQNPNISNHVFSWELHLLNDVTGYQFI